MESACRLICKYIVLHSLSCKNKFVVRSVVTFDANKETFRVDVI